jgi:hypothetical protein
MVLAFGSRQIQKMIVLLQISFSLTLAALAETNSSLVVAAKSAVRVVDMRI